MQLSSRLLPIMNHLKSFSTQSTAPVVLFEKYNNVVKATLNTPKTLNALDADKLQALKTSIEGWNNDPSVRVAIFAGNGGKAFSAGGDLKFMYHTRVDAEKDPKKIQPLLTFFSELFGVYKACANMKPVQLTVWDGIAMGGGAGITMKSPIIIATENCVFGMPLGKLGLVPIVGGGYYFSRMRNSLGYYIALTGMRLKGKEVVKSGIAHFYVKRDKLDELEKAMIKEVNDKSTVEDVRGIVRRYAEDVSGPIENEDLISNVFNKNSLQEIVKELEVLQKNNEVAKEMLDGINSQSTLATRATFDQLKKGQHLNYEDNLNMDLKIAQRICLTKDFLSGVEGVIILKGKTPAWQYKSVADVDEKALNDLFL